MLPTLAPAELRQKRLLALSASSAASSTDTARTKSRSNLAAVPVVEESRQKRLLSRSTGSPKSTTVPPTSGSGDSPVQKQVRVSDDDDHAMTADDDDDELHAALALSLQSGTATTTLGTDTTTTGTRRPHDAAAFHRVMWDGRTTTQEDQSRWLSQGIVLASDDASPAWGLVQNHGGPCGVLAAVEAELLRSLLFDGGPHPPDDDDDVARLTHATRSLEDGLAGALATVLTRAAPGPVSVVLPAQEETAATYAELAWGALDPWPWGTAAGTTEVRGCTCHVLPCPEDNQHVFDTEVFRFLRDRMHYFHRPGGVLLLIMSLVETKGSDSVKEDMDDPDYSYLTSQFGHCSQELLNLLLTGTATSNVFDHSVNVDNSGLMCRGIEARPSCGYLTQLESLRYCSVGSFYKTPLFPVWVLGSQNHFTVLFSRDKNIIAESESESVLERCRRAFRGVDNAQENGFIRASSLGTVLRSLEHDLEAARSGNGKLTDSGVQMLAASLEVGGAGIILWDDFWRITSRLLTGASLENVLSGHSSSGVVDTSNSGVMGVVAGDTTTTSANDTLMDSSSSVVATSYQTDTGVLKSDEEMAKELAAQFANESNSNTGNMMSSVTVIRENGGGGAAKTDEELARELQAQWDAEISGSAKVEAASTLSLFGENIQGNTALVPYVDTSKPPPPDNQSCSDDDPGMSFASTAQTSSNEQTECIVVSESATEGGGGQTATTTSSDLQKPLSSITETDTEIPAIEQARHKLEFESFGDTFTLHHYNGLRGGILTSFKITKLSAEEAVGASVALSESNNGGDQAQSGGKRKNNDDLEDVVRTRWPSCVFDWGDSENGGGKMGTSLID